ncbi:GlmL-related ornithine degradation protein [Halarsenatibacter silvermanii]|uniref:DNA mismatch repair protein MutL n=1 Tax=Halarsenatibacter silvermanii TaxID=321763 RepID=A0A1G9QSA8_9FIRM|nr:GlmL-related ornithine degradation protein [Halarsenatibacter silvermanii]SDM13751.1 conserved hypothetical protein [Halarsenatibacter silvermanii]
MTDGDIDVLAAEIGSTTTMINAFDNLNKKPVHLGQGLARTTVEEGNVMLGVKRALKDLKEQLEIQNLNWSEFLATSSAAGGLKMTVHGLVKDMTVRAAEEAALGAGGVIKQVTVGELKEKHLDRVESLEPNMILLAGGVNHGEEDIILHNARVLAEMDMKIPLIYAGNEAIQDEIRELLEDSSLEILITENVYPKIDQLNIEPTRELIHEVFARHIVRAPGMEKIEEWLTAEMMPTPGAVMEAARLLKNRLGNLVVFDVGGATTDVHSVCEESGEVRDMMVNPEPEAKRTVEGDLGVYRSAPHVGEIMGESINPDSDISPLPRGEREKELVSRLAEEAVREALKRHAGEFRDYYTSGGRKTVAEGKDLTAADWLIGTGGALTRLPRGKKILRTLTGRHTRQLLPKPEAEVLIDESYIMASAGILGRSHPEAALKIMFKSLGLNRKNKFEKNFV